MEICECLKCENTRLRARVVELETQRQYQNARLAEFKQLVKCPNKPDLDRLLSFIGALKIT